MSQRWLRVAAVQMNADEDVESNARRVVDRLDTCAREHVDVAAFHEGVLHGYSDRPEFWSSLDQTRIERSGMRQIIQACREKRHRGGHRLDPSGRRTALQQPAHCGPGRHGAGALRQDPSCG